MTTIPHIKSLMAAKELAKKLVFIISVEKIGVDLSSMSFATKKRIQQLLETKGVQQFDNNESIDDNILKAVRKYHPNNWHKKMELSDDATSDEINDYEHLKAVWTKINTQFHGEILTASTLS
eukprot:127829_1